MIRHYFHIGSVFLIAVLCATHLACDRYRSAPTLSDDEIEEITEGQPPVFVEKNDSLTLEGIEDLYLGQSYDDAMEVLEDYCHSISTFEGGWRHKDAVFKGCNIRQDDRQLTLQVGFWPFNDDRVSTLEIQEQVLSLPVIRARFTELSDHIKKDLPRRGLLVMASDDYRLIANWDDGVDEPAHITIGFHPP